MGWSGLGFVAGQVWVGHQIPKILNGVVEVMLPPSKSSPSTLDHEVF